MNGAPRKDAAETARQAGPGQDHGKAHLRFLRNLAYVLAAIVVLCAGVAGYGLWILSKGPVSLDRFTPYLSSALSSGPNGVRVAIDRTVLSWEPGLRFQLVTTGVHLFQPESGAQLTFREMDMVLSLKALLFGTIAPSRLVLTEPQLRLQRASDGSFHLGLAGEGGEAEGEDKTAEFWGNRLAGDLAGPLNGSGPFGYLRELEIRNATLTVDDRTLDVIWNAHLTDLSLHRDSGGLTGTLQLAAGIGSDQALIRGDLVFKRPGNLVVGFNFADLNPALFAQASPALAPLAAADLPMTGVVRIALDTEKLGISGVTCDVVFSEGAIKNANLPDGSAPVSRGALKASYDPAAGRVTIDNFTLDSGGASAAASGTIDHVGAGLLAGGWPQEFDVALQLDVQNVLFDNFPHRWPARIGSMTRSWVIKHMHDGTVDDMKATLEFHADLAPDAAKPLDVSRFDGTASYHNLTIEYFPPLEPVRGVAGTATFGRTEIDFMPSSGHVLGGQFESGTVKLVKLDTNDETADVDINVGGPLHDALTVLDTEPLGYAKSLSLDAVHAEGTFEAHMYFEVPLKHDLDFDEVAYHTEADLSGVAVPQALFGQDLSAGSFKMTLDRTALKIAGNAELTGVPVKIDWTENLKSGEPVKRRYALRGRIDDAGRQRLGIDYPSYAMIHGPIDIDLTYSLSRSGRAQAAVTADLKDASIDRSEIGWTKAAGVPANVKFGLDFADDKLTAIRDATLAGPNAEGSLSASFDKDGLTRLDVPRVKAGNTDATGFIQRTPQGVLHASISGASFDASGIFGDLSRSPADESGAKPLAIDAKLGRLLMGSDGAVTDLTARIESDGPHWKQASIDGLLSERRRISLRFGGELGPDKFRLQADDFGALLRLLDVTDNITGGTFQITGNAVDDKGKRVLKGEVRGANFLLVKAPLFAKLLSLSSFSGISGTLNGEGIPFTVLEADIVYGGGAIAVSNLRAYGGAIGVNVDGNVDYQAGTLDASGTLVPANILNTVLGNIPVLGSLLLGGDKQGIFAANFRIAGPISDPQVSVNPLSAVAPGVLRKLFLFNAWNPSSAPKAPGPQAPPQMSPSADPGAAGGSN
jgi:hypothetical protein